MSEAEVSDAHRSSGSSESVPNPIHDAANPIAAAPGRDGKSDSSADEVGRTLRAKSSTFAFDEESHRAEAHFAKVCLHLLP